MKVVEQAISQLAISMRVYGENSRKTSYLCSIDAEEAIDNLDLAFNTKLEAFHTLYDLTKSCFDYFLHIDTALIIIIRNAIHHRKSQLFTSLYKRVLLEKQHNNFDAIKPFMMVSYNILHTPARMNYYYKIKDIYLRLNEDNNHISKSNKDTILKNY